MKKFREQGFTLFELTLVATIIGILAAIAMPNFSAYRARACNTEASTLLGTIASCQMQHKLRYGVYVSCPKNPPDGATLWNGNMPEWDRINFKTSGSMYFQYEVIASETGFTAHARANPVLNLDLPDHEISSSCLDIIRHD